LPKEFQFDVPEVEIFRRGDEIVILKIGPKSDLLEMELPNTTLKTTDQSTHLQRRPGLGE
jgi:virulence-associated protein VagC